MTQEAPEDLTDSELKILEEMSEIARKEEEAWKAEREAIAAATRAFREKWPNACEECGGWGGWSRRDDPSPSGVGLGSGCFWDFDVCEADVPATECHRCRRQGLTDDGDGPCSCCGWDYDDGEPRL